MAQQDPLDALFVTGDEVDRELLKDVLTPYVRLDEKGRIFLLVAFFSESNRNKTLILLLARKALALKTGVEEAITPSELARLSDIPDGSLRPTLRLLVEERLVDDENSRYTVLSPALHRCADVLKKQPRGVMSEIVSTQGIKSKRSKIGMKAIIIELLQEGELDSGLTARDIHQLVVQSRPGTKYNPFYKILLDLVLEKMLERELKEGVWVYRRRMT